jgi:superoxide dismutase, Fe-Mn family
MGLSAQRRARQHPLPKVFPMPDNSDILDAGAGAGRRDFLVKSAIAAGAAALPAAAGAAIPAARIGKSPLAQMPLPFADTALEPVISAKTLAFHYGKHHRGYFDTLGKLIEATPMADQTLEEIIIATAGDSAKAKIFNNAAQCWNHNFYWNSLTPARQAPSGALAAAITRDFGSFDACRAALAKASIDQFGTGWGWLVVDNGTLKAISTEDAEVPFTKGQMPLLTVDVWEHAYYIDYQNRRPDHVKAVVDGHLNWEFAARNLAAIAAV